ncbi:MAG: GFA family protein [Acidobacteriota bacterium]|nr:GFA family protein [Acidobacteriota bacterium]
MSEQASYSVQGGCLCGAVRFELTAPPLGAGYCHCTRCQRRTGTAVSAGVAVDPESFRLTRGAAQVRGWQPPDGMEKCFCGECGAHLFSRATDGSRVSIRMSAFDTDPGIRPSYRQYVAYAASWEPIPDDGLPRYHESRPH